MPDPIAPAAQPAASPTGTPILAPGKWQPIAATIVGTVVAIPLVAQQAGLVLPAWVQLVSGLVAVAGVILGIYSPGARKVPTPVNTVADALNEAQKGPQP